MRHDAMLRWAAAILVLGGACGTGDDAVGDASSEGSASTSEETTTSSTTDATDDSSTSPVDTSGESGEPEPQYDVMEFMDEVWTWDQTIDACGYSNNGNPFWDWQVFGSEPVDEGGYPVFIVLHGTGDVADNPVLLSMVDSMARRGFVAASVAYDSLGGIGTLLDDPTQACPIADKKGDCLFASGEGSAITKLCARAKADCSRGIVLAGHSQGAALATAAADYDDRVRAVYSLGGGLHLQLSIDLGGGDPLALVADATPCLTPEVRSLPADRLRVVDGESEYVYGEDLQQDVRDITAIDCAAGTLECLRDDGSGWTFFPDAANEDGRGLSQHCYMADMPDGDCTASTGLNSNWTDGTASYSREPSLTWLHGFVD